MTENDLVEKWRKEAGSPRRMERGNQVKRKPKEKSNERPIGPWAQQGLPKGHPARKRSNHDGE